MVKEEGKKKVWVKERERERERERENDKTFLQKPPPTTPGYRDAHD